MQEQVNPNLQPTKVTATPKQTDFTLDETPEQVESVFSIAVPLLINIIGFSFIILGNTFKLFSGTPTLGFFLLLFTAPWLTLAALKALISNKARWGLPAFALTLSTISILFILIFVLAIVRLS